MGRFYDHPDIKAAFRKWDGDRTLLPKKYNSPKTLNKTNPMDIFHHGTGTLLSDGQVKEKEAVELTAMLKGYVLEQRKVAAGVERRRVLQEKRDKASQQFSNPGQLSNPEQSSHLEQPSNPEQVSDMQQDTLEAQNLPR